MMDFENSCLSQNWDSTKGHPRGPKRYEDREWAAMIQSQVYPNQSDVDWEEYIDWTSAGHGDEWFQAEEDEEEFQAEEDEEEFQAESEEDEEEEGDWQEVFDDDIIRAEKHREAQREDQLFLPGYYEAQTRQRTAYLCQDMVRPCSTSLDDRIVTLAPRTGCMESHGPLYHKWTATDSNRYMTMRAGQELKPSDLQSGEQACR